MKKSVIRFISVFIAALVFISSAAWAEELSSENTEGLSVQENILPAESSADTDEITDRRGEEEFSEAADAEPSSAEDSGSESDTAQKTAEVPDKEDTTDENTDNESGVAEEAADLPGTEEMAHEAADAVNSEAGELSELSDTGNTAHEAADAVSSEAEKVPDETNTEDAADEAAAESSTAEELSDETCQAVEADITAETKKEEPEVYAEAGIQEEGDEKKEDGDGEKKEDGDDKKKEDDKEKYIPSLNPAEKTSKGVKISWKAVEGAVKYRIYRKETAAGSYSRLADSKNTYYEDRSISEGIEYIYTVRAYYSVEDTKQWSGYDNSGVSYIKLSTPELSSIKNNTKGTKITWKSVKNAEYYIIYRKTVKGKFKKIGTAKKNVFTDSSYTPGTGYYYSVVAVHGSFTSGYDKKGLFTVNAGPVTISKIAAVSKGIGMTWKSVSGADKYIVYRKDSADGQWKRLAVTASLKYTDKTVKSGKSYYYTVRAYKKVKNTVYYGSYNAEGTQYTYLAAPGSVSAVKSGKTLKITWDKVKGAEKYKIYRKQAGGSWTLVKELTELSYTDTDVVKDKTYYYLVYAVKGSFKSYHSSKAAGNLSEYPKMLSAVSNPSGVKISWKSLNNVKYYILYRKIEGQSSYKKVASTTSTSYLDINARSGKANKYAVIAVYKTGDKSTYDPNGISCTYNDPTRLKAAAQLDKVGWTLRAAYNWARDIPFVYGDNNNTTSGFAGLCFTNQYGDCLGKNAAFCWMARELGYEAYFMFGCISGANGGTVYDHGWVEIKYKGVTYVFDPQFEQQYNRNGYMFKYGDSGTYVYSDYKVLTEY